MKATKLINKNVLLILSGLSIILVPLLAMQFTDEVNWNLLDFVAAGLLLIGTYGIYALCSPSLKSGPLRVILAIALAALMLLIWAELSVGIFGSSIAGN